MPTKTTAFIKLRWRLLGRVFYRYWRDNKVDKAKNFIESIHYQDGCEHDIALPTIFLTTYSKPEDLFVLTYILKEHDLMLLLPTVNPGYKIFSTLCQVNKVVRVDPRGINVSILKRIIKEVKIYNRSMIVPPVAAQQFISRDAFDPGVLARISMKTNAPIQPISICWGTKNKEKCKVMIGKRVFISPRHPGFKDMFFKRNKPRKFSKLEKQEYQEIGSRLMMILTNLRVDNGSNLP